MKATLRTLLSTGAVMLVVSTGLWAADAAAGKALYATKCKTCHGADGTPPAAMAKAMGIKPMNDPAVQGKSDAQIHDAITKGVGKMKPVAVTPAEADNLVAAVRSFK